MSKNLNYNKTATPVTVVLMLNGGQSDPRNKETATPWQLFELNITNKVALIRLQYVKKQFPLETVSIKLFVKTISRKAEQPPLYTAQQ